MKILSKAGAKRICAFALLLTMMAWLVPSNISQAQAATSVANPRVSSDDVRWDYVYFGHYPQDSAGGTSYYNNPIKWRVIQVNGDMMTLVSEYKLDLQKYHTQNVSVTWNNSYLKKWLNSTFMNKAFSSGEQADILNDPNGKVQILNRYELASSTYGFINAPARAAKNTDYTIDKTKKILGVGSDVINKGNGIYYGAYWLRETSTGKGIVPVQRGGKMGYLDVGSFYANNPGIDVRPMIHVDRNSPYLSHAGKMTLSGNKAPAVPNNIGLSRSKVNTVKVTWDEVFGADGYEIYRSNDGYNFYYVTTRKGADSTSLTNVKLPLNKTYEYAVTAYWLEDGERVYGEDGWSSSVKVTEPAVPVYYLNYPKKSKTNILMKWHPVTGATGYQTKCTYQYKSKGKWKTVTSTRFTDDTKQSMNMKTALYDRNARVFKVQVRAYCEVKSNGKIVKGYGDWKSVRTIKF